MARTYTADEKARARAIYEADGLAASVDRTGIPKGTISGWVTRERWKTHHPEKTRAATATKLAEVDSRRADLALGLMDDIARLRDQLFAPCVERKVVTLAGSRYETGTWEVVDIDRDQPTFAEQRSIITSVAIAVDKVQVLTGEATQRIEHKGSPERTPEQERELAKVLHLVESQAA